MNQEELERLLEGLDHMYESAKRGISCTSFRDENQAKRTYEGLKEYLEAEIEKLR
tara:strand:- start:386 stop:550 length:165 start_codon:yes stop_codon:yes gene_type:complete